MKLLKHTFFGFLLLIHIITHGNMWALSWQSALTWKICTLAGFTLEKSSSCPIVDSIKGWHGSKLVERLHPQGFWEAAPPRMTFELAAEADYFTNGSRDIVGQEKGYQQIKDTLGKFMHDSSAQWNKTKQKQSWRQRRRKIGRKPGGKDRIASLAIHTIRYRTI